MPDVPPAGELAALRARVAELEERLAARDAQLEAAQARLAELAEQIEELRRRLGRDSSTSSRPPSSDDPFTKKPRDRSLRQVRPRARQAAGRAVVHAAAVA
jgi:transposase